jgi:hypothetical protein
MAARALLIRTASIGAALVIGGWAFTLLWPHWIAYRDKTPAAPDTLSESAAPEIAPPAYAADTKLSVLGTDSSISDKPLQLILVSTSPGRSEHEGTARLGTDPRNPQTYGVGSVLANGSRISEIHTDRIVLIHQGRRVTLRVDSNAATRLAMHDTLAASNGASQTVLDSLRPAASADPATLVGGARGQTSDRGPTSRDDLSVILRAQPVFDRDKYSGLKIFAGTRASALGELGLKEGDIVRTVAGKPVEGESAWQVIDDAVTTATPILIGVERDGSLITVSLDSAQLVDPSQPQS